MGNAAAAAARDAPRAARTDLRGRLGLRRGRPRDRPRHADDRAGDADAVVTGGAESAVTPLAMAAFASMEATSRVGHLAALRRPPRRLRDGRGRRRPRARGSRGGGSARRRAAGRGARLRRHLRRLPPDRAPSRTGPTPRGRSRWPSPTPSSAPPTSTTSTPTAPRPLSTTARETQALKTALGEHAAGSRQLDQVGDRPPARRRRRGRGDRDCRSPARAGRPADPRLRRARRGPRPRLRPRQRPPDRQRQRHGHAHAPGRDLQLLRLRRAQRRALPEGGMSGVAVRERPQESGPLERLEALLRPGLARPLRRTGVRSDAIGDRAEPGDGVLAGAGRVEGRTVFATRRTRASWAAAWARPTPTRSSGCWSSPARRARRSSASSSPAAPGCRRATPRSAATAASSAPPSSCRARSPRSR